MLLCLLPFATGASAAPAFTPSLVNAYGELLTLKVNRSRALLRKADEDNDKEANEAAVLLVDNYNDFLELCLEQNQNRYAQLVEAQEKRLDKISGTTERGVWSGYAAVEVKMQLAMSKLLFGIGIILCPECRAAAGLDIPAGQPARKSENIFPAGASL